jgi:predicted HAD superfamily Cof-like phosphohydrolase
MASREVRELAAQIAAKTKSHSPAARERIRAGEVDDWMVVQMAEAALERDAGIEMVREFNKAFGCWTEEKPRLFFPNESGERYIEEWVERFEEGAAALKEAAARFNGEGQQTTGLMLVRMQLALEELAEQWRALLDADLVGLFDALLDRQYVLDGDFHTFGLAAHKLAGLREVHRTNMAKLGPDGKPIIGPSGRVVKPEGWTGPDLASILGVEPEE